MKVDTIIQQDEDERKQSEKMQTVKYIGFTGHREYDNQEWVASELAASIARAQAAGAGWFASGGAAGSDELFLRLALKSRGEDAVPWYDDGGVAVCAFIPFPDFRSGWSSGQLAQMVDMIVTVNDGEYAVWKMHARNHTIVDNSDVMLAVYDGRKSGGTFECLRYARRNDVPIYWINPSTKSARWITGGD